MELVGIIVGGFMGLFIGSLIVGGHYEYIGGIDVVYVPSDYGCGTKILILLATTGLGALIGYLVLGG